MHHWKGVGKTHIKNQSTILPDSRSDVYALALSGAGIGPAGAAMGPAP